MAFLSILFYVCVAIIDIVAFVAVSICFIVDIIERIEKIKRRKHREVIYKNLAAKWLTPLYFPRPWLFITSLENGIYLEEENRRVDGIKFLNMLNTEILEKIGKYSNINSKIQNIEPGRMVKFVSAIDWEKVNIDTGFLSRKYSSGQNSSCTIPRIGHGWVFKFNPEVYKDKYNEIIPDSIQLSILDQSMNTAKLPCHRIDLAIDSVGIYLKGIEIKWHKEHYFGFTEKLAVCMFGDKYCFVRKHDLELI